MGHKFALNDIHKGDKIIKYGTTFEIFQVKVGGWAFFRDIELKDRRFYLVIYNKRGDSIKIIDENLPQFTSQISNILESFFII